MPKIDEVKSEIDFLKDIFKLSIAVLVALMAGLSKLYLDNNKEYLFYLGIIVSMPLSAIPLIVFKKIKKHIKELGELDG